MTVGEFSVFYRELNVCPLPLFAVIGKSLFMAFELLVSLLQINLLIAMLTRTYELIDASRKEWKRQWAQVILSLELRYAKGGIIIRGDIITAFLASTPNHD